MASESLQEIPPHIWPYIWPQHPDRTELQSRLSEGLEGVKQDNFSTGDVIADLEKTSLGALRLSPGDSSADVVVVCGEDVPWLRSPHQQSRLLRGRYERSYGLEGEDPYQAGQAKDLPEGRQVHVQAGT